MATSLLVLNPSNPRYITKKSANELQKCLDKYGLIEKPIINLDHSVIGGHQRINLLLERGVTSIECWMPSRLLDEAESNELCVRLNKNTGRWDYDTLANDWNMDDLLDWGFDDVDLGLLEEPPKQKQTKAVISFEFSDKGQMMRYMSKFEGIAEDAPCKMKIKG